MPSISLPGSRVVFMWKLQRVLSRHFKFWDRGHIEDSSLLKRWAFGNWVFEMLRTSLGRAECVIAARLLLRLNISRHSKEGFFSIPSRV